MQVVVPTMQRTHDMRTVRDLQAAGLDPLLVVPTKETKDYRAATDALVVGCPAKGIALTRQWILENVDNEAIVMVDDDLSFHVRRKDDPTKFKPASARDVAALFKEFGKNLRKYAHVSMIGRQGGNRVEPGYLENSRPWHVFGFNVPRVVAAGAKFEKGLLQDDFDMTLQLLRAGLPNRVLCDWAVNQHHGHGAPGGAASYRTVDDHNASVLKLAKRHAPYVQVREKAYAGDPWLGRRLETVISWKKAFKESQK